MSFIKFLNCKIDLSKWNFAPRIETEFWVERAFKELKHTETRSLCVLDIFAGTGCIGIAVLKNIKNSRVDFVDIDERAIKQIKINLKLNQIYKKRYRVFQSGMFKKIKEKYDFIFANPPYVARERMGEVQPSVLKYEPSGAFFGGKKGLFYIKRFLREAKKHLNKSGVIFLELDSRQKNDIKDILEKEGYKKYQFFKDQFKKYRYIKIN